MQTPLQKLIAECDSGLIHNISPSSKAYLKAFIQSATNLLPEERKMVEDALNGFVSAVQKEFSDINLIYLSFAAERYLTQTLNQQTPTP